MKEMYMKGLIENVKNDLKINNSLLTLRLREAAAKITLDGINYIESIKSFDVVCNDVVIAYYDIETKKIYYYNNITNIVVVKQLVDFLNNYNGYEKYKLTKNAQNKLLKLEKSKDEIDPDCNLSDFEIAEILNF